MDPINGHPPLPNPSLSGPLLLTPREVPVPWRREREREGEGGSERKERPKAARVLTPSPPPPSAFTETPISETKKRGSVKRCLAAEQWR
ncbi:hypothetical protein ZWY2020_042336 [Hordeum vulgare]|nr:hypothetical protein ZWY2020_042336 [Hordeum vulgare]